MKPQVTPFFDEATFTASFVVTDPATKRCAIVDSVLDFDYASGRMDFHSADQIIDFVQENDLAVDAMWTLNGVPTVFGYPLCHTTEADYNCYRFGVMQYDAALDQWDLVGQMEEDRAYHEVVEVPQAFCDYAFVQV